jgi:uncharacterized repeat protein (TIGR03803 family)
MRTTRPRSERVIPSIPVVFALAALALALPGQAQTLSTLYSFTGGTDGGFPFAGLTQDSAGNLYGMTEIGGTGLFGNAFGAGTVFEVDSSGQETVLHNFGETVTDGEFPYTGSLFQDRAGNLYGTTEYGGTYASGTVFRLSAKGKEAVFSFPGGAKGGFPYAGLVPDDAGNVYGTTYVRGIGCPPFGCGIVFKVNSTGKETVLHTFIGGTDGSEPASGLVGDNSGNLYGTTTHGGALDNGTIFKVDSTGKETVLYSFCNLSGCTDGSAPIGGLVRDGAGNLYGTTFGGGLNDGGTVYKLDASGNESVLYNFCSQPSCADGVQPESGLVRDNDGNLYGTTLLGGASFQGTVFKVDSTSKETVLYGFTGSTDGQQPYAGVIRDSAGNLYGTTPYGGAYGAGTVFKITP